MKIQLVHRFEDIISMENLLEAWREFEKGKKHKKDVQIFSLRLMDNIFALHHCLFHYTYKHGSYQAFKINDPKPRDIHKAQVRDRLLHHAIYRKLYPFFNKTFIYDSYSCRTAKGTHGAVKKLNSFILKESGNNTRICYALKCDIRKFFANIDHEILMKILAGYIPDKKALWLLNEIISSFQTKPETGLPLGNLTSQLFVNIYMNEFDQFVKHKLKAPKYIRYADDFLIINRDQDYLKELINPIRQFLKIELRLELHPKKIEVRKIRQGIDFLGYVALPRYTILRTKTKKRMLKKIKKNKERLSKRLITEKSFNQSLQSYYGILKHCEGHKIKKNLNIYASFK